MSRVTAPVIETNRQEENIVKPLVLSPMSDDIQLLDPPKEAQITSPTPMTAAEADEKTKSEMDETGSYESRGFDRGQSPHDLYLKGKSYERKDDLTHAIKYFKNAAEQGHLSAMVSYALLLVATDESMAYEWLCMAADHGSGRAFYHLGQLFARGSLFPISPKIAASCWKHSAALGDSGGRSAMGLCYIRGFGVKQNVEKGVQMVKQVAIVHHDLTAMKNLAWIYKHSKGVEGNEEEADRWTAKAQEREEELKMAEENLALWNISPV